MIATEILDRSYAGYEKEEKMERSILLWVRSTGFTVRRRGVGTERQLRPTRVRAANLAQSITLSHPSIGDRYLPLTCGAMLDDPDSSPCLENVPSEILSTIFAFCQQPIAIYAPEQFHKGFPWNISQTSSRLRRIALSWPLLWSDIIIRYPTYMPPGQLSDTCDTVCDMLERCLTRAREAPLSLHIFFLCDSARPESTEPFVQDIEKVGRAGNLIHHLEVELLNGGLELLRPLTENLHSLTKLEMDINTSRSIQVLFSLQPKTVFPPLLGLRELRIKGFIDTFSECLSLSDNQLEIYSGPFTPLIQSQRHSLKTCCITPTFEKYQLSSPLVMETLESLICDNNALGFDSWLQYFECPKLSHFSILYCMSRRTDLHFFEVYGSRLTRLHIGVLPQPYVDQANMSETLIEFVSKCTPNLTLLELLNTPYWLQYFHFQGSVIWKNAMGNWSSLRLLILGKFGNMNPLIDSPDVLPSFFPEVTSRSCQIIITGGEIILNSKLETRHSWHQFIMENRGKVSLRKGELHSAELDIACLM